MKSTLEEIQECTGRSDQAISYIKYTISRVRGNSFIDNGFVLQSEMEIKQIPNIESNKIFLIVNDFCLVAAILF